MFDKKIPARLTVVLVIFAAGLLATRPCAAAQTETVLYTFSNTATGYLPSSGLIFDHSGNLYGVTVGGGAYGGGVAYELSPQAGGGWTEAVLYSFGNGSDGRGPAGNLVMDSAGNLFGVTPAGGTNLTCPTGCGTVFELSPAVGGGWTETVVHNFNYDGIDGFGPQSALILDSSGNLYGTTPMGGTGGCVANFKGCGTVFELSRQADGQWTETILYNFTGGLSDGNYPYGGLVFDLAGHLYGTTAFGGAFSKNPSCPANPCAGTVFELRPVGGGKWSEQILHNFNNDRKDGHGPYSGLTFDSAGNLYGATTAGGTFNDGAVFQLKPSGGKYWSETILHSFDFSDGYNPSCTPVFGPNGSLYGEAVLGGQSNYGVLYEVTPAANGTWHETTLLKFNPVTGGGRPSQGLVFDSAGNLYGQAGVIFEITF